MISDVLPLFRVRLTLRVKQPVRLHAHHGATIYSLLANAYGLARECDPVAPDGVIPLIPEQCRVVIATGEEYAFGLTLLAPTALEATRLLRSLTRGLRRVGRASSRRSRPLWGNFTLEALEDLAVGRALSREALLEPLPRRVLEREIARVASLKTATVRFVTPLRAQRLRPDRRPGASYFDRDYFPPHVLLDRLQNRCVELGLSAPTLTRAELADAVALSANRLVWLDLGYGPADTRKSRDGAAGRVVLEIRDARVAPLLALGQYVHVGEGTRWGLGGFRVEELGADPFACRRSASLLELALRAPPLDLEAERLGLPAGAVRAAADRVRAGDHQPAPPRRISIPKSDGSARQLAIPGPMDLALQRAVLAYLAPGLDAFFEDSSLAYRRGLGRQSAARRTGAAAADGFRYALRADIEDFFDSVDHAELRERLDAFLADDGTVRMLLEWVRSGAPGVDRGLPTGAPLSPLLSNLFLDQFDEAIARQGARLARYADDFLVLYRNSEEAEAVFEGARQAAEALQLRLNENKTARLDLREPFEFLGFRFEFRERWDLTAAPRPTRISELGWHEARVTVPPQRRILLPGEAEADSPLDVAVLIIGPGLDRIEISGESLVMRYADGSAPRSVPIDRVREVVIFGRATMTDAAISQLLHRTIPVLFVDRGGRPLGWLEPQVTLENGDAIMAQTRAADDPGRRLAFGRALIAAKLWNYAALAEAFAGRSRDAELPSALRRLSEQARQAGSLEELLGYEGAGAARWYADFSNRIDARFNFERRVAPAAADPINALLNLAFTHLHRRLIVAIRLAGLTPAIGLLHACRAGHAALASDLQEPFRHLMDRLVIEASCDLRAGDFVASTDQRLPLRLQPAAARRFIASFFELLARGCRPVGNETAAPYWVWALVQARALRRGLDEPSYPWEVFRHEPVHRGI